MKNDDGYSLERLAALLQSKGIRSSAQRIAVLSAVADGRRHPSAEDIYTDMSKQFPSLSRTTVYNSLRILSERGLLRELEIESGCLRYDMAMQAPHSHFICRVCSRIFDMPMPDGMAEMTDPRFDIDTVEVTLRGLCPECRKLKSSSEAVQSASNS